MTQGSQAPIPSDVQPGDSTLGEAGRFAAELGAALAENPAIARRLRRCGTDVVFRAADGDAVLKITETGLAATFTARNAHSAPTVLTWAPGALDRFATGSTRLATVMLLGDVTSEGPVGRLLAISPIVSGLLGDPSEPGTMPATAAAPVAIETLPDDFWAVEAHSIHKRFGASRVLRGVDLKIPEGAVTVILGPSGTGKSVMLKHIVGLLRPDAGDVIVHGRSLKRLSAHEMLELRRRFGILFQDGALFGSMSLFDNVAFPLRQHTTLPESEIARIVHRRLTEVGLGTMGAAAPGTLSGGQRKRAGLARALVLEPDIVMFDEPDSGLDPVRTSLLSDLILDTHAQHGGTHIVITHDIRVAHKVADYVIVLWQGEVVEFGVRSRVFDSANPFVRQFLRGSADGPLGMD